MKKKKPVDIDTLPLCIFFSSSCDDITINHWQFIDLCIREIGFLDEHAKNRWLSSELLTGCSKIHSKLSKGYWLIQWIPYVVHISNFALYIIVFAQNYAIPWKFTVFNNIKSQGALIIVLCLFVLINDLTRCRENGQDTNCKKKKKKILAKCHICAAKYAFQNDRHNNFIIISYKFKNDRILLFAICAKFSLLMVELTTIDNKHCIKSCFLNEKVKRFHEWTLLYAVCSK